MNLFRLTFVMPLAAIVTLGLFAMMSSFIRTEGPVLQKAKTTAPPVITAQMKPTEPRADKQKRPTPTETDPPDIYIPPAGRQTPDGPTVTLPPRKINAGAPTVGTGGYDGPIIRTRPVYPQRCLARGVEGSVLVQFDVTPEGDVVNVRIIDSPDSCFNRAVLRSVTQWKYSPATDANGKPVMRYNVVSAVSFRLEE
ncbi:MAG: energy transducer TonB [Parvularculaceae bacterium]